MPMLPYELEYEQYSAVYNALSFVMASMGASTIYFFFHSQLVKPRFKTALCVSALVTLIAFYHYFRIFNSWVEAYEFAPVKADSSQYLLHATGLPFNDAYRYMDWLLTVPLLLIEIVLCQKLSEEETVSKATKLGLSSALMIILGYPGEMILDENQLGQRWVFWAAAMVPFLYIVQELIVGLAASTKSEEDPNIASLLYTAQYMTVISWLTYPVVYVFPMMGFSGAQAVIAIQIGYCISDVISKCGVGLVIYKVTVAKSYVAYGKMSEVPEA